jgi:hypothetical protein
MFKHLSITSLVFILSGAVASAQDLPTYEAKGFPITPLQASILGCSAHVQERVPTPALTMDGMPASPHQIAVLMPRPRDRDADQRLTKAQKTELH